MFAAVFLFGRRLHFAKSRRAGLSVGAGASTAYVFVHLLPELAEAANVFVEEREFLGLPFAEVHIYLSALVGFVVFYALEHMVAWSRRQTPGEGEGHARWVFFLHVSGFALYGGLISYLMVRGITDEPPPVLFYAVAMGLHFLSVDHSLQREHSADYTSVGRFILAGAVLVGWTSAVLIAIPKPILLTGLGLVSGGVVMNAMIMELPSEKEGRFWPFALGAAIYTTLLLVGQYFSY